MHKWKKIFLVFALLILFFFTSIVQPIEKASANPLAVGGALYLGGAGVYVLGAVGIAAIAGIAGCESCAEDIEAHAARTWEGSTQLVKDGVQLMVNASVGAWGATSSALTAVDANVNTWMDGEIEGIVTAAMSSKYGMLTAATSLLGCNCSNYEKKFVSQANSSTYGFMYKGQYYKELFIDATPGGNLRINFQYSIPGNANINVITTPATSVIRAQVGNITTAAQAMAFAALYTGMSYGVITNMQSDYSSVRANATEAWEEMTDAGLVLPVDNAKPMMGDIPLTYDPVTDSYAGIDGITVPHDKVTGFDFGKVNWKSLNDLAALGLTGLGAGLYIDGMTGNPSTTSTYDPATDMTTTTTTTTGTTTNVTTGETVSTGETTTTSQSSGDTTTEVPPVTGSKPVPKINFRPLVMLGGAIKETFPFSIPWDVALLFGQLNADPITPIFKIATDKDIYLGDFRIPIKYKFDIDFSVFDGIAMIVRWGLIIVFDIAIFLSMRKLMPE